MEYRGLRSRIQFVLVAVTMAAALLLSGCQTMIDTSVRSNLGFDSSPPNLQPITSFPTTDPELQVYLKYLDAVNNDLVGILGEPISQAEREEQLKEIEEESRKTFEETGGATWSADQIQAMLEDTVEKERRSPTPRYVTIVPPGWDPKSVTGHVTSYYLGQEGMVQQSHYILITRKFDSLKQASAHANKVTSLLRPVFASRPGWKFTDPEKRREELRPLFTMLAGNEKESSGMVDPAVFKQQREMLDKQMRLADAGQFSIMCMWENGHRKAIPGSGLSVQSWDLLSIMSETNIEPDKNGKYVYRMKFNKAIEQKTGTK